MTEKKDMLLWEDEGLKCRVSEFEVDTDSQRTSTTYLMRRGTVMKGEKLTFSTDILKLRSKVTRLPFAPSPFSL